MVAGVDLDGMQLFARNVAGQVAEVHVRQLGSDLVSFVAHGSGVKGGIIPGSSDLDFAAIVRPGCVTPGGELPLERALALHRDLARIDLEGFRYVQAYVDGQGGKQSVGFIPGTYHVLFGSQDVPLATADDLVESAHASLASLDPARLRDQVSHALLNHGEGRLVRQVRLLCTDVWPAMYQVACLQAGDPVESWQRTKHDVVRHLSTHPVVGTSLKQWWDAVNAHYAAGETVDTALAALAAGVAFIEAAATWYQEDRT